MIEVKNLVKKYGDRCAVDQISFSVNKGEVLGFLGPNGAGKSTTMKIITGYMSPSSGAVTVAGHDVFENPIEVKSKIGYLPETPPVYGEMKVSDYLGFVAELKACEKGLIKNLVGQAIEKTNLESVQNRLIQNLSKGFRQRVGIAQAIVSNPEILILDEPTVGLDPKQVSEIRNLISSLKGDHTIILSTHILPEVQASCDRIVIINNGKIVAEDTPSEISNKMQDEFEYNVQVARPSEKVVQLIEACDYVNSIRLHANSYRVSIVPTAENAEKLASQFVGSGCGLLEFKRSTDGLEDVFIKLTSEEGRV